MADELEKSQNYNAAVGGVGYVGLFSLLSFTHDLMNAKAKAIAALCLLLSVTFYLGWVVGTMYCRVRQLQGHGTACAETLMQIWHGVLIATILPAFIAFLILGGSYLVIILK